MDDLVHLISFGRPRCIESRSVEQASWDYIIGAETKPTEKTVAWSQIDEVTCIKCREIYDAASKSLKEKSQ
jgi:hypothetical protein